MYIYTYIYIYICLDEISLINGNLEISENFKTFIVILLFKLPKDSLQEPRFKHSLL